MIINSRRKKQIECFVDKDHAVMTEYYDVLEESLSRVQMRKKMEEFIERDPLFFDPYCILADILIDEGKESEAKDLLEDGYKKAVSRIADKDGEWPKEMEWGFLENRHLMRMLERYAYARWEAGEEDAALDIFRRLLQANPNDNQGARHAILAIRMGLGADWSEQFAVKDGPMAGEAMDAMEVTEWFENNAKKFPEEFNWWFEKVEEDVE